MALTMGGGRLRGHHPLVGALRGCRPRQVRRSEIEAHLKCSAGHAAVAAGPCTAPRGAQNKKGRSKVMGIIGLLVVLILIVLLLRLL